ncbi:acyl-CoA dehydrogenase family protein [Rhodococcus sp. 24CO]|uniref:acyl-CoA dehydrogenase family protein n=1 Tax=Rhodococcus sp. 24CO TaxID=3117460 RepID=UPI003D344842
MKRSIYDQDHEDFRSSVKAFIAKHITPNIERWDSEGFIDRDAWKAAGEAGLLGISVPGEYGGGGIPDFRFRMVQMEEFAAVGANSFNAGTSVQDDLVIPYLVDLGTHEQKQRWLPSLCDGTAIGAMAMTEPGAGSDLQGIRTTATRDGDDWVLQGSKIFITNGIAADVVIVLAKTTHGAGSRGMSLFLVPTTAPGFRRGRKLEKLGLRSNDTAELFFDDLRLPADSLLGHEGKGFVHVMERLPRERMSIAATAVAAAAAAFEWTRTYCFERHAFGQPIGNFQATRFTLAEIATDLEAGTSLLDRATVLLNAGELSAVDAAQAKYWLSDMHNKIVDRCLQLHGGYGYMLEYPIAKAYADARILPIYGGTNEIMKEIIGRDIAHRATH